MLNRTRKLVATAVTLGLAASLLTATAPAASAAELIPGNEIHSMTITPTSLAGSASGTSALLSGPSSLTTSIGCPEGFRFSSRTFVIAPNGTETTAATSRTNQSAAAYGLQGNPMTLTGARASNWSGFDAVKLPSGLNRFVVTCDPSGTVGSSGIGNSKYFVAYIYVDREAESWTQVEKPALVKTTPAVAFTNARANLDGSVTVSTTISGAAGTATNATGSVSFTARYAGLATPVTGAVKVANGIAAWTTPVLRAGTAHSFTASYKSNGDANYNDSATDATTTVTTVEVPTAPGSTDITVTVPAAATALKVTITPGDVALGAAKLEGGSYVAMGALGTVTIVDLRAPRTAWTLSGRASAFENAADKTKTISASSLGWAPALIGSSNAATAGVTVTPNLVGTGGGLANATPLAKAPANAATTTTTVGAAVTFKAQSSSVPGDYRATLTLTLI